MNTNTSARAVARSGQIRVPVSSLSTAQKLSARSLKRRNFLVHHFWRERIQEVIAEASRAKLCADLKADCRLFTETDERLTERVFDPLARKRGITPEMIAAQYENERREAMKRYEPESFTADEDPA